VGEPTVVFDRVWKKFRRGERHDSLRDLIPAVLKGMLGRPTRPQHLQAQEFWAVQDVSFEVGPGEALGIIGPNGAGKSTTLKLLTKILRATQGSCRVKGRIGALIEIAAGFHPDLTGRENVYLQGAVMGMKRAEIARKFDEIVDFSGTASFIDTPAKRYSSGMNARLGFSIAAHLNPDVLIIDEVLSVGDMAFQQKCVARMSQFKRDGVAIVFVSHNLQAVDMLCDRALYLQGKAVALGDTPSVVEQYILATQTLLGPGSTHEVRVDAEKLTDAAGTHIGAVAPGAQLRLRATFQWTRAYARMAFGIQVFRSTDNLLVYDGTMFSEELDLPMTEGGAVTLEFAFTANLTRGHYYIVCQTFDMSALACIGRLTPAASFSVAEDRTHSGVADIQLRVQVCHRAPQSVAPNRALSETPLASV
jgi:ABC-type polysaccharide/polyol phosphate transport system ATPase subunit